MPIIGAMSIASPPPSSEPTGLPSLASWRDWWRAHSRRVRTPNPEAERLRHQFAEWSSTLEQLAHPIGDQFLGEAEPQVGALRELIAELDRSLAFDPHCDAVSLEAVQTLTDLLQERISHAVERRMLARRLGPLTRRYRDAVHLMMATKRSRVCIWDRVLHDVVEFVATCEQTTNGVPCWPMFLPRETTAETWGIATGLWLGLLPATLEHRVPVAPLSVRQRIQIGLLSRVGLLGDPLSTSRSAAMIGGMRGLPGSVAETISQSDPMASTEDIRETSRLLRLIAVVLQTGSTLSPEASSGSEALLESIARALADRRPAVEKWGAEFSATFDRLTEWMGLSLSSDAEEGSAQRIDSPECLPRGPHFLKRSGTTAETH